MAIKSIGNWYAYRDDPTHWVLSGAGEDLGSLLHCGDDLWSVQIGSDDLSFVKKQDLLGAVYIMGKTPEELEKIHG